MAAERGHQNPPTDLYHSHPARWMFANRLRSRNVQRQRDASSFLHRVCLCSVLYMCMTLLCRRRIIRPKRTGLVRLSLRPTWLICIYTIYKLWKWFPEVGKCCPRLKTEDNTSQLKETVFTNDWWSYCYLLLLVLLYITVKKHRQTFSYFSIASTSKQTMTWATLFMDHWVYWLLSVSACSSRISVMHTL